MTDKPRTIDLDAARKARAEAAGDAPTLIFGGRTIALPNELPALFLDHIAAERLTEALRTILAAEDLEHIFAQNLSVEDLVALSEGIADVYGLEPGGGLPKSPASG